MKDRTKKVSSISIIRYLMRVIFLRFLAKIMPFIYFVRHPVMLCFSKIYLAIGCFKNTALIKEIYGLLLFPVFLYFWNSLHHFCDKISISEVRTLRLTPILPLLICHLSSPSSVNYVNLWHVTDAKQKLYIWQYGCQMKRLNIRNTDFVTEMM